MYFLVEMPKCLFLKEAHFSRHLNEVSELIPIYIYYIYSY